MKLVNDTPSHILHRSHLLDSWPLGDTPLVAATHESSLHAMRVLLEGGADPDITYQGGSTALSTAAADGNTDAVELLLEHGADAGRSDPNAH